MAKAAKMGHNSQKVQPATASSLTTEDKTAIRMAVLELSESFTTIEKEREIQKDIIGSVEAKFGVPKKLLRKMARTYFDSSYMDKVQEQHEFENMYNAVVLAEESEEEDGD